GGDGAAALDADRHVTPPLCASLSLTGRLLADSRRGHRAVALIFPQDCTAARVERVEVAVVGADVEYGLCHHRPGGSPTEAAALEAPDLLAGVGVQGIERVVTCGDVDDAAGDGRRAGHAAAGRELPQLRAGARVECVECVVVRA